MKKVLWVFLLMGLGVLTACSEQDTETPIDSDPSDVTPSQPQQTYEDYRCKDIPLSEGCYVPSGDLDFQTSEPMEFTIDETFEFEMINQMPSNWLLYSNPEYRSNAVTARVVEMDGQRVVRMYSDGLQKPPYPQNAQTPTFIFTTKFNLDQSRKGVAFGSLMIPTEVVRSDQTVFENKTASVSMGVSTGAVNAISVVIGTDMKLSVKVGGPFFYYSGSGDGGEYIETPYTLDKDQWYDFKFEWDAALNIVRAYLLTETDEVLLYEGPFHISNRFNAVASGDILVPNVFKVTMPSGRNAESYAFLKGVRVEHKGDLS